jgi:acetate kinase
VAPANGAPNPTDVDREISAPGSAVRVAVIRAREEYAIARDIALLLARAPKATTKSR